MPLMSMREYSRHRGVTLRAVQKAVQDERIKIDSSETRGKKIFHFIDSDAADQAWTDNTDPNQQRAATRGEMMEAEEQPAEHVGAKSKMPEGGKFQQARTVRELFAAKTAELDYKRRNGELIDKHKVEVAAAATYSIVKQNLMGISSRVGAVIAAKVSAQFPEIKLDDRDIMDIIDAEVIASLKELSDGVDIS